MSQQINLLNPIFRKQRFSFTSATAMLYGVAIAAALTALAAVYEDYRLRALQAQARTIEGTLKQVRAQHDKLTAEQAARKPDPQFAIRIAQLDTRLKNRQEIIEALQGGVVGATDGFSEYMRVLSRQSINGLWLTGFDIMAGGSELTLSGRALSADLVPAYLKRLNQEKPLQGRQFATMRIDQSAAGRAAATANPGAKDTQAPPALPPYLEFMISSGDLGAATKSQRGAVTQPPPTAELQPTETVQLIRSTVTGEPVKRDPGREALK